MEYLSYLLLGLVVVVGIYWIQRSNQRTAYDVYLDLDDSDEGVDQEELKKISKGLKAYSDELGKIGIIEHEDRVRFRRIQLAILIIIPSLSAILTLALSKKFSTVVPLTILGWGIAYIISRCHLRTTAAKYQETLDFYLPLVMERLVMAVEAGFDIVAAVQNIVELEDESQKESQEKGLKYKIDPVTKLLKVVIQLSNAGLRFEKSLSEAANISNNNSIKHAFIHLALAHKEGGELIMPLRELSDATQLQYQEIFEENIAKMPIKATLPLVFTFAGLIVFFLTAPIVQVIKVSTEAMTH